MHANKLSTTLHNNIDDLIAKHSVPSNVRKDLEAFLLAARYITLLAIGLYNNNAVMDGFMDCNVTAIRGANLHLGRARQWHVTVAPGNMEDWKHKMSGVLFDRKADMCVRVRE